MRQNTIDRDAKSRFIEPQVSQQDQERAGDVRRGVREPDEPLDEPCAGAKPFTMLEMEILSNSLSLRSL